jgi:flagellar motor switch protein FliN
VTERDVLRALVEELANVAAAMIGGDARVEPGTGEPAAVQVLTFGVAGSVEGHAVLGLHADDARMLAGLVMGFDEPPSDEVITDSLQEMSQQAASAVTVNHGPEIKVVVDGPVHVSGAVPNTADWAVLSAGSLTLRVAMWHSLTPARQAAPAPAPAPAGRSAAPRGPGAANAGNLDLILDIELPLWVRFGATAMTLQALCKVAPGTTIDLERSPDDPVDVMVNETVIARGEVVVVGGNYGVRVTEVVSTTDRIRSMAG